MVRAQWKSVSFEANKHAAELSAAGNEPGARAWIAVERAIDTAIAIERCPAAEKLSWKLRLVNRLMDIFGN